MKRYTLKVPPGENLQLQVVGDYVRIESSLVTVIIEEPDAAQTVYLTEGDDTRLKRFKHMYVRHDDAATQTVILSIGDGTQKSSSKVGGAVAISGTVDLSKSDALSTAADLSVAAGVQALVIAANANRRELILTSLAANAGDFRVGDINTAAARGTPLRPGDAITLTTTAAVYAFNTHTAAMSIAITEVLE